jgi:hypothetical protein
MSLQKENVKEIIDLLSCRGKLAKLAKIKINHVKHTIPSKGINDLEN